MISTITTILQRTSKMKFKFLLFLSAVFFSFNVNAQAYITVCAPDTTVPVNLYAGSASCYATGNYPFGYTGFRSLDGTYTSVVPEQTSSTIVLGSTSWVSWDEWVNKYVCNYLNQCSYQYVRESRSGTVSAYCSATVPFSRVGTKVVKGVCRQELNTRECGCDWSSSAFAGGDGFAVYRPTGSCAYDTRTVYWDGRTSCSGSAWPKVTTPSSSTPTSSSATSSSAPTAPSGASCTWPSSPNNGASSGSGYTYVYYAIGACTTRYKEVNYDSSYQIISTKYY